MRDYANEYADLFAVVVGLERLHSDLADLMEDAAQHAENLRGIIQGHTAASPLDLASVHRQLSWLAADVQAMAARVNMEVENGS